MKRFRCNLIIDKRKYWRQSYGFFLKEKMMQDSLPAKNKFYVSPSVSMGIGRDFAFRRANRGKPFVIYLKGGISALYPFKTLGYLYPTAEAGLAMRFSAITVFVKKVRRE